MESRPCAAATGWPLLFSYVSGALRTTAIQTNHSMADTSPPSRPSVLVLVAHPAMQHSRINRRLMQAARGVPGVAVRDLYALYPDYLIDIAAEREALAQARLVVWQHPIHWYGMTPMLRLWADEVLAFGWAYGAGGRALRGKDLWLVASTGGDAASYRPDAYNRYPFDAFLPPYEQAAALCGMRFLPPRILYGVHGATPAQLEAHAAAYAQRLASYPDWPEIAAIPPRRESAVPDSARPHGAPEGEAA